MQRPVVDGCLEWRWHQSDDDHIACVEPLVLTRLDRKARRAHCEFDLPSAARDGVPKPDKQSASEQKFIGGRIGPGSAVVRRIEIDELSVRWRHNTKFVLDDMAGFSDRDRLEHGI